MNKVSTPVYFAVLLALIAIVWLSTALVRVENERYALSLGMCRDAATGLVDGACLKKTQTRTGWWWHLYYAL